ncbi:hypothetical protein GCM10023212_31750 [Luteolibacter yonseiensis]
MKRAYPQHTSHGMHYRRSLYERLIAPRGGNRRSPKIIGGIKHDGGQSDIIIANHGNPLISSPWVNCREPWVRRSVDWHFLNFGAKHPKTQFCWVLDLEWKDHFRERLDADEAPEVLCEDAAHWQVEAMRRVLSRHWHGWKQGIDEWPREWVDYSHGRAGVEEYLEGRYRAV